VTLQPLARPATGSGRLQPMMTAENPRCTTPKLLMHIEDSRPTLKLTN